MKDLTGHEEDAIDMAFDLRRPDDLMTVATQAERRLGGDPDLLEEMAIFAAGDLLDGNHLSEDRRAVLRDALLFVHCHARLGTLPGIKERCEGF